MPYKDPIKQKQSQDQYYLANKDKYRASSKKSKDKRFKYVADRKAEVGCHFCSENDPVCLDFHHKDPSNKEKTVSYMSRRRSLQSIKNEIAKCIVLCSNCHRKLHKGKLTLKG